MSTASALPAPAADRAIDRETYRRLATRVKVLSWASLAYMTLEGRDRDPRRHPRRLNRADRLWPGLRDRGIRQRDHRPETADWRSKASYGDPIAFIHQEVYVDNQPNKGLREPLRRFNLKTEPWLFVFDRHGRVQRPTRRIPSASTPSNARSRRPCSSE